MKTKGYVRLDSFPIFYRIAFKNNYIRERSNFGRQYSNFRSNSSQGYGQRQNSPNRAGNYGQGGNSLRPARSSSRGIMARAIG